MMSTQWFDPIATLGYLAAHTTRTRLMTNVFIAAYQPPLTVTKAFATLDRLSNGRMIVGDRCRARRRRVRRARRAVRGAGQAHRRGIVGDLRRAGERVDDARPQALRSANDRARCSNRIRRSGSAGRASRRCDASRRWPTAGSRRRPRSNNCRTTSTAILRERDRVRPGRGSRDRLPPRRARRRARVGTPQRRDARFARSHRRVREQTPRRDRRLPLQVRLFARDASEHCDQIAAFGAEVGPQLIRTQLS